MIGVAAGYTWSGISELKQMWIEEAYRGRGYARALLNAIIVEACSRGVRRIWVASYDFQAPGFYEKAGFKRIAEFEGWPDGHINVILCKTLSDRKTRPKHCRVLIRPPTSICDFADAVASLLREESTLN
jgi:ribosomal protein S18 acetylase RimI-like enzyme